MQKITPFLWFNDNAEEAVGFYTSIFKDSGVVHISRYGDGGPGPKGSVMTATFLLNGQEFIALNGGPHFRFTEAISFFVHCASQDEVDYYWNKLIEGGQPQQCGWLKDRYGLSWQIVPDDLQRLLQQKDPVKAKKVMEAMMAMVKLDLHQLRAAAGE